MYERFTEEARQAMQMANSEAQRCHQAYVGTEFVLLALLRQDGEGTDLLRALKVDPAAIQLQLEIQLHNGPHTPMPDGFRPLPLHPHVKKVIEWSMVEARELHDSYVAARHLLLGLLRQQDGVAGILLDELGVDLETARVEACKLS